MGKRYDLWGFPRSHPYDFSEPFRLARSLLWSDSPEELISMGWEHLRTMRLRGENYCRCTVFDNVDDFPSPKAITQIEIGCDLGFL